MSNYNFLVLGFVIVGLLFAPTLIPNMVPTAEAAPMDNPADAIDDLTLSSISKYSNQDHRNSITLSWSEPNDNGSPILFYSVQAHDISGDGWTVLENDVYGTTYTHDNAATPYQFSYRVYAIAADGCNGSSSTFYNACNESNILHVVSLPNAESGTPTSECEDDELNDCGYWDVDLTGFNVVAQPGYNAPEFTRGEANALISGTVQITNQGAGTGTALVDAHLLVTRSDGTVWHDANVINDNTLGGTGPGSAMSQGWGWNESILSSYPLGAYTYTFTIDPANTVAETNENNNVYTGTFTVSTADTTPENDSSPATGPFTITDDSTGGDCTSIGTWSSASKTCTLNTDVATTGNNHGISIASSDII